MISKVPPKIAISHIFVISEGNILYDKAQEILFLVFLVESQLYFTRFLKIYVKVLLLKKYLTLEIEKNMVFFLQFYEAPDLGKKIFTTWNVLKSEVYMTCINFWKIHDDLKVCLEVIRLPSWPESVKFIVKLQFFVFDPLKNPFFN